MSECHSAHAGNPFQSDLFTDRFLPSLSRSDPSLFIVWTFIVNYYWRHRTLAIKDLLVAFASTMRQSIQNDWYLSRRHRLPDTDV